MKACAAGGSSLPPTAPKERNRSATAPFNQYGARVLGGAPELAQTKERTAPRRLDEVEQDRSVTFPAVANAVIPERASRSVARRRHRPSTVGTPADCAMAKAACSRPHPSSADLARSLSTRAPTMTFIMSTSPLALRQQNRKWIAESSPLRSCPAHSVRLRDR